MRKLNTRLNGLLIKINKNDILLNEKVTRISIIFKNQKKIYKIIKPGYDSTGNNLYYKFWPVGFPDTVNNILLLIFQKKGVRFFNFRLISKKNIDANSFKISPNTILKYLFSKNLPRVSRLMFFALIFSNIYIIFSSTRFLIYFKIFRSRRRFV